MSTRQLLVQLPEELVERLERTVPPTDRSAFIQHLLEKALPTDAEEQLLYQAGVAVERDTALAAEMADWDVTVSDGLGRH